MTINSEPIYDALFTLVKSSYAWTSAQRRLRHPDDLRAVDMPAVFQVQVSDSTSPDQEAMKYGIKEVSENALEVELLIFVHSGSGDEWPSAIINPILDALKNTFGVKAGPPGNVSYQNLGGLVQYAMVSGTTKFYENAKSSSIMAIVPIKILAFN